MVKTMLVKEISLTARAALTYRFRRDIAHSERASELWHLQMKTRCWDLPSAHTKCFGGLTLLIESRSVTIMNWLTNLNSSSISQPIHTNLRLRARSLYQFWLGKQIRTPSR